VTCPFVDNSDYIYIIRCFWKRGVTTTTRGGERRRLLARREKHSLWRVGIYSPGDQNTHCAELGTTRQATKYTRWASNDIFSLGEIEHSPWRAMIDKSTNKPLSHSKTLISTTPNPKTDRKHYLVIFYNLDITSLH